MMTNPMISGTFDTAVTRCSHQCSTPCPEAPSPCTRENAVRMETRVSALLSAMIRSPLKQQERHGPDHDGQRNRTDKGETSHGHAHAGLHGHAEIPYEMAHAAQHVMHQHPS